MNQFSESRALRRELRRRRGREFIRSTCGSRMARLGMGIIVFFILMAIFGPMIMPFKTTDIAASRAEVFNPPSAAHLLGTDNQGRDVLAYLMSGARTSLFVGATATLISMVLGTMIGITAGYLGGWVVTLLMRITDFFLVLPWLPFCMVLAAILGNSM